jgi:hypothetical protein
MVVIGWLVQVIYPLSSLSNRESPYIIVHR